MVHKISSNVTPFFTDGGSLFWLLIANKLIIHRPGGKVLVDLKGDHHKVVLLLLPQITFKKRNILRCEKFLI
jgi:hypothetical protein